MLSAWCKNNQFPDFNKLIAERSEAKLKQANLVIKTDFDNNLKSLNMTIKILIMFLVGNQMEYLILNLSHYILLSYAA